MRMPVFLYSLLLVNPLTNVLVFFALFVCLFFPSFPTSVGWRQAGNLGAFSGLLLVGIAVVVPHADTNDEQLDQQLPEEEKLPVRTDDES